MEAKRFLLAAASGDAVKCREMLVMHAAEGVSYLGVKDDAGMTPLHSAVFSGSIEVVQMILAARADVDVSEAHGTCPLQIAAATGAESVMALLINARAGLNRCDTSGATALHAAVEVGNLRCIEMLIGASADVNVRDANGTTPLASAITKNAWNCAKLLCEAQADLDLPDSTDTAPLCLAVALGHNGCVELLLKNGAQADRVDRGGTSALHAGCEMGQDEAVRLLLAHRASTDLQDTVTGSTPLLLAAANGHLACVSMLLSSNSSVGRTDHNGCTALHVAGRNGDAKLVSALLDAGADVDQTTSRGETALGIAVRLGHAEAGSRLLAAHEAARRNAIATEAKRVVSHTSQLEVAIAAEARARYAAEAQERAALAEAKAEAAEAEAQATAANVRSRVEALVQATDAIVDSPSKLQTAKGPSDAVGAPSSPLTRDPVQQPTRSPNKKATTSPNARQLSPTAANQALAPSPTADLVAIAGTEQLYEAHVKRIQEELAQREPLDGDRHRSNGGNVRASAGRNSATSNPWQQKQQRQQQHYLGRRHAAAVHIQACYRRHTVLRTLTALNTLATVIQCNYRGLIARRKLISEGVRLAGMGLTTDQRDDLAHRWAGILPGPPSPPTPVTKHSSEMVPRVIEIDTSVAEAASGALQPTNVLEQRRQPMRKRRTKQRLPGDTSRSGSNAASYRGGPR